MNQQDSRWLPPSPHREAVLEFIKRGRAHIEERGHNQPPLLVFEDGGVMLLPEVRLTPDGKNFMPTPHTESSGRQTEFSDVCGCIDRFVSILEESPDAAGSKRSELLKLLGDTHYMIRRIARRAKAYDEFRRELSRIEQGMASVPKVDTGATGQYIEELKTALESCDAQAQHLVRLAEKVREVANKAEKTLSQLKKAAIEAGALYRAIKGARNWP